MHVTTRDPTPLSYFTRIRLGDVGFIRRGRFHLLFSAGCPLGERRLGVDVPLTFKPLDVGLILPAQSRPPGYLSTNGVRGNRVRLVPPTSPPPASPPPPSTSPVPYVRSVISASSSTSDLCSRMLEYSSSISFQLARGQGAALVTRHQTYGEDIQRAGNFEKYTKNHYASWVMFARENGYGNDINPVLVTGIDRTKDFATMSYSNNDYDTTSEFTTSPPGIASSFPWGTWHTTGSVHTNCGPQLRSPPSSAQAMDSTPSDNNRTETVSDEYNQCVFVRYYTVRKRLGIPRVIKAAAGPRDLGPGYRDNEEAPLEAQYDSDPGSGTVSSLLDDRSSVTSMDSESDIVIHNTTAVRYLPWFSARFSPF